MAIFNDLKKILFGAKAVTQSAAEKAVEAGKEAGKDLSESSADLWEKAKEKAGQVGAVIMDKAETAMEKAADFTESVGEKVIQTADVVADKAKDLTGSQQKPKSDDDVMSEIFTEAKTAAPASEKPEEFLELPPLKTAGVATTTQLIEAPEEEEPSFLDSLKTATSSAGATVIDKSGEVLGKAGDFTETVGAKVMETGSHLAEKFGDKASEVGSILHDKGGDALEKAKDLAEDVGGKVLETGGRMAEKFGETATEVGGAIFEKGGEALDKAKDALGGISSKIWAASEELFQKAQAEAAKEGDTDSLIEKAKNLGQKLEDRITGNNTRFADKPLETGGSELNKHGSFWEKAERFASGDYHGTAKPGEIKISQNPDFQSPAKGKVKGFDDQDNDGDELIDDAIIDDGK
jgi:ElaB/YqjD/DUF883 family membrane-anchored ribosome-binding protein